MHVKPTSVVNKTTPTVSSTQTTTVSVETVKSSTISAIVKEPIAVNTTLNKKRQTKTLPSAEVQVTPLISYSKVAKASSTLEELQKELQSQNKV